MRGVLEMPLQGARVGVERDQAVRVQVVALAPVAIPIRPRISRAPVDGVRLRLVGAGHPGGGRAGLPALALPGIVARLPLGGNGVEAPGALAGFRVIRVDES